MRRYICVMYLIVALTVTATAAPIVSVTGYIPAAASGGTPVFGVTGVPNYVGGTAQDQQYNVDTFWNDGVFPDKNHNVASFTNVFLTDLSWYSSGKIEAELIALGGVPHVSMTGNFTIGDFQAGFTEDSITYPGGTPVFMDGASGGAVLAIDDVADAVAIQFFSSDKNDGFVELWVNDEFITRYDTWCQGFWYMEVTGLDANTADLVEFRTSSDSGPHLNTLNLNAFSENAAMKLPGDDGYPEPNDFHVDFVAYTPVPEPGTLALLTLGGSALAGWVRRRRAVN